MMYKDLKYLLATIETSFNSTDRTYGKIKVKRYTVDFSTWYNKTVTAGLDMKFTITVRLKTP